MARESTSTVSVGSVLAIERLAKRFGGLHVLDDISFELRAGEVLGVIGPNGAGKTTLVNMISGQLVPSSGRIRLNDADVTGKPMYAMSRLGVVRSFQQTSTFASATIRENMSMALRFSGTTSRAWNGLEQLARVLGLAQRMDEQSDKLPYGLQKMLGLLMAYATGPKALLLDEPAAGLELGERRLVDEFIAQVQRDWNCSVLIVEHDMDMIRRLCPRIIVLNAGSVLATGETDEVLARRDVIDAYIGAVEEEGR